MSPMSRVERRVPEIPKSAAKLSKETCDKESTMEFTAVEEDLAETGRSLALHASSSHDPERRFALSRLRLSSVLPLCLPSSLDGGWWHGEEGLEPTEFEASRGGSGGILPMEVSFAGMAEMFPSSVS